MAAFDERSQGDFWVIMTAPDSAGSAGAYTVVGFGTNDTLNRTFEIVETSDKQTAGVASSTIGKMSWSHDFEGNYVPGDTGQAAIETAITMQQNVGPVANWWKFVMVDAARTPVTGAPQFEGQGWVTDTSIGAPTGDKATLSFTVSGTGTLTKSTVA